MSIKLRKVSHWCSHGGVIGANEKGNWKTIKVKSRKTQKSYNGRDDPSNDRYKLCRIITDKPLNYNLIISIFSAKCHWNIRQSLLSSLSYNNQRTATFYWPRLGRWVIHLVFEAFMHHFSYIWWLYLHWLEFLILI